MRKGLAVVGALLLTAGIVALVMMLPKGGTTTGGTRPEVAKGGTQLKIEDLQSGTGREAQNGNRVTVHYRGTLENGKQFDASYDRGEPFTFELGAGQVIKGWEDGIHGMKEGGKRRLTIPPSLGYGDQAQGPIPANSTLIFEVELLKVL